MFINFIIDYPFEILAFILIILILFIIKHKLYGKEEEEELDNTHISAEFDQQWKLTRKQLAEKTRQYQSGNLSWQDLIDFLFDANKQYPEDQLIFDLYDLIEHEPKRGGFLGVSEEEWKRRQRRVTNIINTFEQDSL